MVTIRVSLLIPTNLVCRTNWIKECQDIKWLNITLKHNTMFECVNKNVQATTPGEHNYQAAYLFYNVKRNRLLC